MLEESSVLLLLASRVYHLHFQGDQQSWQYKTLLKAIKIHSFRKKNKKQTKKPTMFMISREYSFILYFGGGRRVILIDGSK